VMLPTTVTRWRASMATETDDSLLSVLTERLGAERVSAARAHREAAAADESSLPASLPDVVVWPETTDDVAAVVTCAADMGVPVTPRGAGSSLEGNPIPVRRGIVLDLTRMNRVLAVRRDDLQVDVQPGVVYDDLNRVLRPDGLIFPPSPGGSNDVATIGGMVANNASGIYSVKYGGTRAHVLGATVVTGAGQVMRLGTRCRKSSSGYHLIGLLVGSEGTLAVATELTLALAGLPAARRTGAFVFGEEPAAARAVADLIRFGIDVAAIEFLDRRTVGALNAFRQFGLIEQPSLFVEVHGSSSVVDETWAAADSVCREAGGEPITLPGGRDPWEVRHDVTRAIQARRPEAKIVRTDLAFPISALPDMVTRAYAIASAHGVTLHTFGHAGIGILHALILEEPGDATRWAAAQQVRDELVRAALAHEGSVSGEHGIGLGNRAYMREEHGPALDLMQRIKAVFDPEGILNPGKIW
jgi:D-lactate dehydrogenase (cytochrome)